MAVICALTLIAAGVFARRLVAQSANDSPPETIDSGTSKLREIAGGETKSFRINVIAGQYLRIAIQLKGIILRATLLDSAGNPIVTMSNPSGGYGTIYLSEIAKVDGSFTIKVFSAEDFANAGAFQITVDPLRTADKEDEKQVAAERLFAKAVQEDDARQFKAAIDDFGKAFLAWQEIGSDHWQALNQYALAQTYRRSGNVKLEEEFLNRALEFHLSEDDWRLPAAERNDLGFNVSQAGDNQRAISLLTDALRSFEAHHDRRGQASSLNNLAIAYGQLGDPRKALEYSEKVLPLRREENLQAGVNNALNTLGAINDKLGEPYKALDYLSQALSGWQNLIKNKKSVSPDQLANAFNSLALANEKVGDLDRAQSYYQQALAVPNISQALRAAVLDNKGELYAAESDFETALTHFASVKDVLASLPKPNPDLLASVLLHVGQVKLLQGDTDGAFAEIQQAQAAKPNKPKLSYVLTALGDCWRRAGDLQAAVKSYQAALDIQLETEDRRGQAITHQKIGETYVSLGDLKTASDDYQASLTLWRGVSDQRGEAATLNDMGVLEQKRNNLVAALEYSEQATQKLESARTSISSHKLRTSYFADHQNYYELNIDLKMMLARQDRAPSKVAEALAANERSRARTLLDMLAEDRLRIAADSGDELLRAGNEVHQKVRAKLEAQTALLSVKHTETEAVAIAKEVLQLLTQEDEIESRIRSENPKYSELTQPRILAVNELQQQIDDNTVLLEYSLGDERGYVWAVTSNSIDGFELPARKQIEAAASRIVKSIAERRRTVNGETGTQGKRRLEQAEREFDAASAELSDLVIRRVAPLLGTKRLVIVADGALQRVSFAALPLPRAGAQPQRRLIDDHEIIYEPSASVLALQRTELGNRQSARQAVAILADPVFAKDDLRVTAALRLINPPRNDQNSNGSAGPAIATPRREVSRALEDIGLERFSRLDSSATEAQTIADIAKLAGKGKVRTAVDFDASRETATSSELSEYRIVHFATHAVVNYEHPDLSGIVLSMVDRKGQPQEGYLRLHDVYNLNLPADLVVLSACQTGVGKEIKGEGLIALTRGFMYAGAQRVVASLWKVDDAATAQLMAEFYKQILTKGQRPAAALRAAQLQLAKRRSPVDWAGFVLQGEWK